MNLRTVCFLTAALLLIGVPRHASAQSDLKFDGARAKQLVAHLCRDEWQGRMTCTEGYRKAADWSAGRFRAWGLAPAGEDGTYFQDVTLRELDWYTGIPTLLVARREFFLDDGDYSLDSLSTAGVTKKGEVVFVGYGIVAPKKGLDEYSGVDVKGKIVLVLTGSPKDAPEQRNFFRRSDSKSDEDPKEKKVEDWKAESTDQAKIETAYAQGASAILFFDPDEASEDSSRRRSSRRSRGGSFKPDRDFLCFKVKERIFRAIMKQDKQLSPRGLTRQLGDLRRAIKAKQPQSLATGVEVTVKGYDSHVRHDKEHKNNVARNVLAKIEGTDPKLKNQYVLAGAHLDHVGMRNGYVYNGADDNTSGSAVVLELARMLAEAKYRPKRTIIFCLWCGEERGLYGSNHYSKKPCDGVDMDRAVTYFNLDMVGMGEVLGAPGALNFPAIWKVICRDQDPEVFKKIEPSVGGPGGSDHSGFIRQGIEALALMSHGVAGHPDYHQPEDDIEKIDEEMMRVTGQFVLRGMMNLADESQVALLIPRRKELYAGLRMRVANYNPTVEGSSWTQVDLKAKDSEQLQKAIYDLVRETIKKGAARQADESSSGAGAGPVRKSLSRGVADWKAVGSDERLLDLVIDMYGIGRADVAKDDGFWFKDGELTEDGTKLLKAMETRKVVLHLLSPSPKTLAAVASAATRPFVVSGALECTPEVIDRLKRLGCPIGVTLDPAKPGEFLKGVEELKKQFGQRNRLFAMLQNSKNLDAVKQTIYMGLLDRGWAHDEIVGGREHRGLMGGATLSKTVE